MDEIEASVTRSWASIFINASDKEELLYEDLISIYHTMYNLALPGRLLYSKLSCNFNL